MGTTVRHTDSSQVVANTYEQDAWGVPFLISQLTAQHYRFTGKELDPDFIAFNSQNRRYHFPARFYIPSRGVFAQVDPAIRNASARELMEFLEALREQFRYAISNPVTIVDPDGRVVVDAQNLDCGKLKVEFNQGDMQGVDAGAMVFTFVPKIKCGCCAEYGWIQHILVGRFWHYDNRASGNSDPTANPQPNTGFTGGGPNNPWYGAGPGINPNRPTPQRRIGDNPGGPETFRTQLVCVETGQVLFTWEWDRNNKAPGSPRARQVPPP